MSKDEKEESSNSKKNGRPNHTGSVAAEDPELTLWLNRLWARNEPPERIEVWQKFSRNKAIRGEMIFHEDFKFDSKLDVEQVNRLANEIMEAAQHDCDSARRGERDYDVVVIDRNRKASPLTRRLGPLIPKRQYALAKAGDVDEDDDTPLDAHTLNLKYVQEGLNQTRWDKQRNDRVLGDVLLLMGNMIQELRTDQRALMSQHMSFFQQLQEAEDRRLDRELLREREKFKLSLYRDGVRTARNLLPGLFGDGAPQGAPTNGAANGTNGHTNGTQQSFGASQERTLVDNFLNDCEEAEISVALFGDFAVKDGKLSQIKPGIFSLEQFRALIGVRDGKLSPDTLDQLMPMSGHALAVTQEQIKAASDAGMTEGIGMALLELVGLRRRKKEAIDVAATTTEDETE